MATRVVRVPGLVPADERHTAHRQLFALAVDLAGDEALVKYVGGHGVRVPVEVADELQDSIAEAFAEAEQADDAPAEIKRAPVRAKPRRATRARKTAKKAAPAADSEKE